ncbi:MAG: alkaline phosphatase family protein [Thermoanaerobaculia bacterium]
MLRRRAFDFLLAFGAAALSAACRSEKAKPAATAVAAPARAALAVEASDVAARERHPPGERAPVIWIGLDGLDWELLDRLSADGRLPNWKRLTEEGWTAKLSSPYPLISPILWTSAATGLPPDLHRVLDFQEVDPKTGRKVPISGDSRAAPAVWNIASQVGRKVGVVGWWATHPAEEVNGFFVSDRVSPMLFSGLSLSGSTYPTALEAGVAQVAQRDGRVDGADLAPYLEMPASEIAGELSSGAGMENRVVALSRILSATRVTQRIARDLYDRERPDLTAVYFEGTDEVGHVFASFTPPRADCRDTSDADYRNYSRAVATYYAAVDRILGQWMRRAEEDGGVLLVHSDHGFKWGSDRPCGLSSGNWATAAFWHRPEGVLALWGRGVERGRPRGTASLYDIAPTVLALIGAPADRRMAGTPIAAAYPRAPELSRKDLSGLSVRRVAAAEASAAESDEYAKKLLALGYLSPGSSAALRPPGGERPGMTEAAWNNLGTYERETKKNAAAARKDFERALELNPGFYAPMFNLAVLYRDSGDTRKAEDWFFRSLSAARGDPSTAVAGWAREYIKEGKLAAAASLLDHAARLHPGSEAIAREKARLAYRQKDCRGAVAAMAAFAGTTRDLESINDLVLFHTCLADREEVERLLVRSLAIRPDQPEVARLLEVVRRAGRSGS